MFTNEYVLKLEKDDNDTWLVTCPDFPEVTTFGENKGEAVMRGRDAIEEAISARIAYRQDVPSPGLHKGKVTVSMPHQTFLKIVLWNTMKEEKVKKAELARRLSVHGPQIDRLVDIRHQSRPELIDAAFAALGKQIKGVEISAT